METITRRLTALLIFLTVLGGAGVAPLAGGAGAGLKKRPLRASCCCGTGACNMAACPGEESAVRHKEGGPCAMSSCVPAAKVAPLLGLAAVRREIEPLLRINTSIAPMSRPNHLDAAGGISPAPLTSPPRP